MQAKTLLKPLTTDGWGAGLEVGNQYQPDKSIAGDLSVNVPVSFSFNDDKLLAHVNSDWLHKHDSGRNLATWGAGTEVQLTQATAFTSEMCWQDVGKPFFQFGVGHQLITNRLQVDASYGDGLSGGGNDDRFFTVGIEWSVDALIP